MLKPLTHPLLINHARHGFFNRHGGVSRGLYSSLNGGAGSKDNIDDVMENRRRVQEFFAARKLITLHQCHSATAIVATPDTEISQIKADGMVTADSNIALCILTADCAPILLVDQQKKIIGACHAGWRGAVGGVIENTVQAMKKLGSAPANIAAVIGPLIGKESYEVGEDMRAAATQQQPWAKDFFTPLEQSPEATQEKFLFDLAGFCAAVLKTQGVERVANLGVDTLTNEDFFSNRRNKLQGQDDYGRLMSVVMIGE